MIFCISGYNNLSEVERFQQERNHSITHQIMMGEKMISYLYLSNAGAIVALIGYLAQKELSSSLNNWKCSAMSFCMGAIFSIGALGCAYWYQIQVTLSFNRALDIARYNELFNTYLQNKDNPQTPRELKCNQYDTLEKQYEYIKLCPDIPPKKWIFNSCIISGFLSVVFFIGGFLNIIWHIPN